MSNKNSPVDLNALFASALGDGALSPEGKKALDIVDLGAQIQAGLGVSVDDVEASEVVLVTIVPDDSGSIAHAGNVKAVYEGHNAVVDALAATKQKDSIFAHNRYLNGHVLYPYRPVKEAVRMGPHNYNPQLGTPLYDQMVVTLGTVLAKVQEFAQAGVPARSVTLVITDGADAGSSFAKAKDVKALVKDLLASERHIVAAMGIDDGQTHFRDVFRSMGIDDRWILTTGSTSSDIRRAFAVFSQSAVRASQGGASFSRTATGGFGAP